MEENAQSTRVLTDEKSIQNELNEAKPTATVNPINPKNLSPRTEEIRTNEERKSSHTQTVLNIPKQCHQEQKESQTQTVNTTDQSTNTEATERVIDQQTVMM